MGKSTGNDNINYVTIVFKYYETDKKSAHNVTDLLSVVLEAVKQHNRSNYNNTKFELYGISVEQESEINNSDDSKCLIK